VFDFCIIDFKFGNARSKQENMSGFLVVVCIEETTVPFRNLSGLANCWFAQKGWKRVF